jgi:hypothetical protein
MSQINPISSTPYVAPAPATPAPQPAAPAPASAPTTPAATVHISSAAKAAISTDKDHDGDSK